VLDILGGNPFWKSSGYLLSVFTGTSFVVMTSHHEKERYFMSKHSHKFVDEYDGLVGFGLSREVDEHTLTYYLQKFSDDQLMALIRSRMSEEDMEELFNLMGRLGRIH
jgi:hypothetical protein